MDRVHAFRAPGACHLEIALGQKMPDWENKKILVLGLGQSGVSATRFLSRAGARLILADTRACPPGKHLLEEIPAPAFLGAIPKEILLETDVVLASPGLGDEVDILREAKKRGVPVISDIEVFAGEARAPILAVTGSNGKSTVVSLLTQMLERCGKKTVLAGNIGTPALDALDPHAEAYVLELSSFQLERTYSLKAHAAAVLNVTQDHLDRYPSLLAYASAKARIFLGARTQVLNLDDPLAWAMAEKNRRVLSFGLSPSEDGFGVLHKGGESFLAQGGIPLFPVRQMAGQGPHQVQNALAALALAFAFTDGTKGMEALASFSGLPHRLERIGEREGVRYLDDSKGTNVGATLAAMEAVGGSVVLIAGGDGKGQDFSPLAPALARWARFAVLLGKDAAALAQVARKAKVPFSQARDMEEAVLLASSAAKPGDVVLLSPACASTDMFSNYHERGLCFRKAFQGLG